MSARGPRRRLRAEEHRLWQRVTAGARPLRWIPEERPLLPEDEESSSPAADELVKGAAGSRPAARTDQPKADATPRHGGPSQPELRPSPVGRREAGLDARTTGRLRRGMRAPDARIDLHGMTAGQAHGACLRFLAEAHARGHRVVLVITGKGGQEGPTGPDAGRGVLRASLPAWLSASPLGRSIVGIYQAHRRHGGEGAFYVYLKRHR